MLRPTFKNNLFGYYGMNRSNDSIIIWFLHLIDRETLKKEGVVRGLYAGTIPSLAANVAENSILFAAYGLCQKLVASTLSVDVSKLSTFSNGCAGRE